MAHNARTVAEALSAARGLPMPVVFKGVLTTPAEIESLCRMADADPQCAGLVLWMHTFSPGKMWIRGLKGLRKPFLHLHTQFHRDLPFARIDMDYMNLHQSAHGDREAGFIHSRLGLSRKIVVGHWADPEVHARLSTWMRAARAWHDWRGARFARFGDNMRQVAVTEGDKVEAEARFGFAVDGYGVGDLVSELSAVGKGEVDELCSVYEKNYAVARPLRRGRPRHEDLRYGARTELGLRRFLEKGGFSGFTTTFEDLHGLRQLPGLAVQRLMAEGYGFGAEGDWKTAALVRAMKVMADGLPGGTSFMEDYTYHLDPNAPALVLGAHMLEICPSIAARKPSLEIHPLGIGGKEDPVRLVFESKAGPAVNASLVDLGSRFRLIVSEVDAVPPPKPLPRLPVARAFWKCLPDFKTACEAWIRAGGAHHTGFSLALKAEHLRDFGEIARLELVVIDQGTRIPDFEKELRWNEVFYRHADSA